MKKLEKIALWAYVVCLILAVAMIYCVWTINGAGFLICGYGSCIAGIVFMWADYRSRKACY